MHAHSASTDYFLIFLGFVPAAPNGVPKANPDEPPAEAPFKLRDWDKNENDDSFPEYEDFKGDLNTLIKYYDKARAWILITEEELINALGRAEQAKLWHDRYWKEFDRNQERGDKLLLHLDPEGLEDINHVPHELIEKLRKRYPVSVGGTKPDAENTPVTEV